MSAPSKAYTIQLVKIQPEKRLAITSELNPAPGGVIHHREARGMGYWAATQVKGLSPEIIIVSVADVVHVCGRQNSYNWYWRGYASPTGSKTVARYQKDGIGTWESHNVPSTFESAGYGVYKPEEGEIIQMALWQSDKPIVVMKQSNVCGAKGLAGEGRALKTEVRDYGLREDSQHIEGKEAFLKSRVREIRKHGSVRGFIVDSERRWL